MKNRAAFILILIGSLLFPTWTKASPNPMKPTDLTALSFYDQINLLWTDNAPDEEGFIVERRSGIDPFKEIASLSKDTSFYLDMKLAPRKTYYYRVKAFHSL